MVSEDQRIEFLRSGGAALNRWLFDVKCSGMRTYLADLEVFLKEQVERERIAWEAEEGPTQAMWGEYNDVLPDVLRRAFIVALMIEAEGFVDFVCLDAACLGQTYTLAAYTTSNSGVIYYADSATSTTVTSYYSWAASTSTCTSVKSSITLYPFKPVPADVVNLLPNPPYSMELVY